MSTLSRLQDEYSELQIRIDRAERGFLTLAEQSRVNAARKRLQEVEAQIHELVGVAA